MPTKNNQAIADPDTRDSGIADSKQPLEGGSRKATAEELALALEASERRNAQLEAQLANPNTGSDSIKMLADLLSQAIQQPKPTVSAVPESDNLNRSTDFKNQRATVDGQNMLEAQQTLAQFRNEERLPISVSKTIANQVGAYLTVSVNGVQIRIPCDGKTYYINKTHWEHARERLAKLDILNANIEPQVLEIS
jgi:hypothetical protein